MPQDVTIPDPLSTIPDAQLIETLQALQLACAGRKVAVKGRASQVLCGLSKRLAIYLKDRGLDFPPPPLKAPSKGGPPVM